MMPNSVVVTERTLNLLSTPSTATLTTVLAKQGFWNTFLTGVRPLSPGKRIVYPSQCARVAHPPSGFVRT